MLDTGVMNGMLRSKLRVKPLPVNFLQALKTLPRVVQNIFRFLSYSDKLNLRLVNTPLLEIINSNASFTVTLHDEVPECRQLFRLPIRKCMISQVVNPRWKISNLQFPSKLRKLIITGPISFTNFKSLQDIDLNNLHELEIQTDHVKEENDEDHNQRMLMKSTSLGLGVWFPNLRSLNITGPSPGTERKLSRKIFRVFLQATFQQLTTLKLRIKCSDEDLPGHLALILPFVARHWSTLKDLSVDMTEDPLLNPNYWNGAAVDLEPMFLLKLRYEQLKAVHVKRLFLSPVASGIGGKEWAALLYAQRRLESLECHFHVCPMSFYHYVLNRNWNCLKEVTLLHLTCWEGDDQFRPLDLSAFHSCAWLQSLTLSRYTQDSTPSAEGISVPSLINIQSLPGSLKKLNLSGFPILSNELYGISRGFNDLESLTLIGCGNHGQFGISGTGLEELLTQLGNLKTILVIGVNTEDSEEELKLRGIIAKVNSVIGKSRVTVLSSFLSNPDECKLDWSFNERERNPFCQSLSHHRGHRSRSSSVSWE